MKMKGNDTITANISCMPMPEDGEQPPSKTPELPEDGEQPPSETPEFRVGDFFILCMSTTSGDEVTLPSSPGVAHPSTSVVAEKEVGSSGHAAHFPDPLAGSVVAMHSAQVAFAGAFDPMRFEVDLQPILVRQHEAQADGGLELRSSPEVGVSNPATVCYTIGFGVEPLCMATTPMTSDCIGAYPSWCGRITNWLSALVVGPDVAVWPDLWFNCIAVEVEVACEPIVIGLTRSRPADRPPRHSPPSSPIIQSRSPAIPLEVACEAPIDDGALPPSSQNTGAIIHGFLSEMHAKLIEPML
jgi:hypothetical protein